VSVHEVGEGARIQLGLAVRSGSEQLEAAGIETAVQAGEQLH
jgi:hypothetical protein